MSGNEQTKHKISTFHVFRFKTFNGWTSSIIKKHNNQVFQRYWWLTFNNEFWKANLLTRKKYEKGLIGNDVMFKFYVPSKEDNFVFNRILKFLKIFKFEKILWQTERCGITLQIIFSKLYFPWSHELTGLGSKIFLSSFENQTNWKLLFICLERF